MDKKKGRWTCRACGELYKPKERSQHVRRCVVRSVTEVKSQIFKKIGVKVSARMGVGSDGKTDSTHYGGADNPHETIKCLEAWGLEGDALLWNSAKYISRAGKKIDAPALRELEKAHYYLGRRIAKLKEAMLHAKAR